MAVKFFGQFLVEKGLASRDDLLRAIELQESVNLSFGDLAVAMKFMSEKDVLRVNQAQRTEDLRFGDMAVKLGIISAEQLQQVLAKQKSDHLYIGEALVKVGGIRETDLPRYLEEFKADQALYSTDQITIPAGMPNPKMCEITADLTFKMLTRIARLTFRLEPGRIATSPSANDIAATMRMSGDVKALYVFTASRGVQNRIAAAMLGETDVSNEPQEVLDDTIMEFVNVVCGNIAAKAAQSDTAIEISPPELVNDPEDVTTADGQTGLSFSICFADGEIAELLIIMER